MERRKAGENEEVGALVRRRRLGWGGGGGGTEKCGPPEPLQRPFYPPPTKLVQIPILRWNGVDAKLDRRWNHLDGGSGTT